MIFFAYKVAFLKQDNILDIIKSKYQQVTPSLEQKIIKIKQEGQAALLTLVWKFPVDYYIN